MKLSKWTSGDIALAIAALLFALAIPVVSAWAHQEGKRIGQEKGKPCIDTFYRIERDTVYIDRSRPINKPWYSYEIESREDSIYLYSGRELIGVVGRKEATVFYIDSLIIADNL